MARLTRREMLAAAFIACAPQFAIAQDQDDEPDPMVLGIALADAPITLEMALRIAEQRGKPISAKFGMPEGDLQLSACIVAQGRFIEVLINPTSGSVTAAHPLTDPDDLADASAQRRALGIAKISLLAATEKAVAQKAGFRAVKASPELKDGQSIATILLLREGKVMTVPERLN